MCTAITLTTKDHYFGRNLDLEYSYKETVTITPRNYPFYFRKSFALTTHHAMIGMAYVKDDYPLYYDAMNEMGLSIAGLHFPGYACYLAETQDKFNIAPFEFLPWVLGRCSTVSEAVELLGKTNLIKEAFSSELPLTPLHFLISDQKESIVVEPLKTGLKTYQNPIGVLTNSPTFDIQLFGLNNYRHLSSKTPDNTFAPMMDLKIYSNGLGSQGLPGSWSSQSRFIKAAFVKSHSVCEPSEHSSVNQFFHLLSSVEHPRGCVEVKEYLYEITVYSSCLNMDKGIYYYKTYDNNRIIGIDMFLEDLEQNRLISYSLIKEESFSIQNHPKETAVSSSQTNIS
jgi:choloylglycine hydrolase